LAALIDPDRLPVPGRLPAGSGTVQGIIYLVAGIQSLEVDDRVIAKHRSFCFNRWSRWLLHAHPGLFVFSHLKGVKHPAFMINCLENQGLVVNGKGTIMMSGLQLLGKPRA